MEDVHLRHGGFLGVPHQLFSDHDDQQLCGQLNQTAAGVTLGHQEVFKSQNTLWILAHFVTANNQETLSVERFI